MSGGYKSSRWSEAQLEIVTFAAKHDMDRRDLLKMLPGRTAGAIADKILKIRRELGIQAPRGRQILRKVMQPSLSVDIDPIGGTDESFRSMCRTGSEMLGEAIERYQAKQRFILSSRPRGNWASDAAPTSHRLHGAGLGQ